MFALQQRHQKKDMESHKTIKGFTGIVILSLLLVFSTGCGRKGPPSAPDTPQLPVAGDVRAEQVNGHVSLIWSLSEGARKYSDSIAGFYVYRADVSIRLADCENCPRRFRQVGAVAFRRGSEIPEKWRFDDSPPKDTACFYIIRSFRASGALGPESETLRIVME